MNISIVLTETHRAMIRKSRYFRNKKALYPFEKGQEQEDNMNKKMKTSYLTQMGLLSGIIVLMAFTPLGYLRVGALSITFIMIPVAIGGILMGPRAGGILGAVFGMTSYISGLTNGTLVTVLMNVDPVRTFILCVVTRALMGLCVGLIFQFIQSRTKGKVASYIVASASAAFLNTVFFVSSLGLLFYGTISDMAIEDGVTVIPFLLAFITINSVVELVACAIVGTAISKNVHIFMKKQER